MENKELLNNVPHEPTEEEVKEAERKGAIDKKVNNVVKDNDKVRFEQVLNDAKAPIVIKGKDFKMGEGEVDIRQLSEKDYRQLMFRLETVKTARLQSIDTSLLDILRLLMVSLKKQGVQNITEALDNIYTDLQNELKEKTIKK